ncbi:MAG TPA: TolC family protein, partial [Blastocatellia bacterium]|nr:TolC family protein [Blastocatellia bacterium]
MRLTAGLARASLILIARAFLGLAGLALVSLSASAQSDTAARLAERLKGSGTSLRISVKQAVQIGLASEGNARIQIAEEIIRQTEQQKAQVRAALLPDVEASISDQSETRNLAAFGIQINIPIPGFSFPRLAGPFSNFDARTTVTQSVFDISSIRRFQASQASVSAAQADSDDAKDQVSTDIAAAYLAAQRAEASLSAIKANIALAEALEKLAINQKNAGVGTGLDVTRARVQLANERQRLLVAENDVTESHLRLLKAVNLDLGTPLELEDALTFTPPEPLTVDDALKTALQQRPNLKAQVLRERNAELNYSATKLERVPSVVAFGDYGSNGTGLNNSLPTRTYGFSVRVPVFDGGRRDARRAETMSVLQQQQIRTKDLQQQVQLEVRVALDALKSAAEEVKVAEEG